MPFPYPADFCGMQYLVRNLFVCTSSYITAISTICLSITMHCSAIARDSVSSHCCTSSGTTESTGTFDHRGSMPAPHLDASDVRVVFNRAVEQVLVHAGEIPPLVDLANGLSRMALVLLGVDHIGAQASRYVCRTVPSFTSSLLACSRHLRVLFPRRFQ